MSNKSGEKRKRSSLLTTAVPDITPQKDSTKTAAAIAEARALTAEAHRLVSEVFSNLDTDANGNSGQQSMKMCTDGDEQSAMHVIGERLAVILVQLRGANRIMQHGLATSSAAAAESLRAESAHSCGLSESLAALREAESVRARLFYLRRMQLEREMLRHREILLASDDHLPTDLVSLDECPSSLLDEQTQGTDEHRELMVRLTHELCERKRLRIELRDQQKELRDSEAQLSEKSLFLEQLHPNVVSQLKGLRSLRADLELDPMQPPHEAAFLLCTPLYTLYRQALACSGTEASHLQVSILGDQVAAERTLLEHKVTTASELPEASSENAGGGSGRCLSTEQAYAEYPLSVQISLPGRTRLELRFVYLPALQIVAVRSRGSGVEEERSSSDPVRLPQLLSNLFPGDTGTETPNLANCRLLLSESGETSGSDACTAGDHLTDDDDGDDDSAAAAPSLRLFSYESGLETRPYHWAQRVCGLHYPPPVSAASCAQEDHLLLTAAAGSAPAAHYRSFADWLQRLQDRMAAHAELASHLRTLSCGEMVAAPWRPSEARLISFSPLSADRFWKDLDGVRGRRGKSLPGFAHSLHELSPDHWVVQGASFYSGSAICGVQTLNILTVITAEYPDRPPLFCVSASPPSANTNASLPSYVSELSHPDALKLASTGSSAANSSFEQEMRELETEVNLHQTMLVLHHLSQQPTPSEGKLLGYQVARLLLCFEALCKSRISSRRKGKGHAHTREIAG
eukprot:CAMPEP_0177643630 /NCGR_PEP_ID=MMETSP0447-20121125/8252_1 /TAXON_ID=0 /ORGANISM="Stygamoeba regulata, Strain BSH-02190019" /LENGTH=743 /DNA_ID=CAMNT_0019145927 /DNA_START=42 /DNA_END=2269 /DNA_ORIENTATION=-